MRRHFCSALLLVAALSVPAAAQSRADQSRLSFGIGLGYNGGSDLWQVSGQPISAGPGVDTADVGRRVRPTLGITFIGVYYPNDRWGFSGEAHLLGLGYEDTCVLRTNSGSQDNAEVCTNVNGKQSLGTAASLTAGVLYRPLPWSEIQPYVRFNAGAVLSQQSAVRMNTTYIAGDSGGLADYFIFQDKHPASITPMVAFASGFTAFISRSSQVRFEVKDNIVSLAKVTGTVPAQLLEPTSGRSWHQIFSLTMAIEVVLEKHRGRRY